MRRSSTPLLLGGLLALSLATASPAPAQTAPPNDLRADAVKISGPSSLAGTTAGSTFEPGEPGVTPQGTPGAGSVWYELATAAEEPVVVRLQANGNLDGAVDVFRRVRSQLVYITTAPTDDDGRLTLRFNAVKNGVYLIRVLQRTGSEAGTFTLEVFTPKPRPKPPGTPMPASGARGTLDGLSNTADAFSMILHEGVTYRVNLNRPGASGVRLSMFAPGARSFDGGAVHFIRNGYALVTPGAGEAGRWGFLLEAGPSVREQAYRLSVAPVGGDDLAVTAPLLPNRRAVSGSLDATGTDVVDVHRFDLVHRSHVRLSLRLRGENPVDLRLIDENGRTMAREVGEGEVDLADGLRPGRYYVIVRARGATRGTYRLTRLARVITRVTLSAPSQVAPGSSVPLSVTLSPVFPGPATITIERYDPVAGWHHLRRLSLRLASGRGTVSFTPPTEGRYRASVAYHGTVVASPADGKNPVRFTVRSPLRES